jgi:hypothetical protein
MPVALTSLQKSVFGNKRVAMAIATVSGTYGTGGETITAATLGMKRIDQMQVTSNATYWGYYDHSTAKLRLQTATATEASGTITDGAVRILAIGV